MKTTISLSEKIYKTMLELYPSRYRDEFGQEMIQLFQDMYQDAKNSNDNTEMFSLWMRIIHDYFISLTKEHLSNLRGGDYYMHKKFDTIGLILWIIAGIVVFPVTFFLSMMIIKFLGLGNIEDQALGFVFVPLLLFSLIGSQWLILKRYTDRAKNWLVNTALAWIVIIASTFIIVGTMFKNVTLVDPSHLMIVQLIQAFLYGGILGYFQRKALTGFKNTLLLIPANIIAILMIWVSIGESISGAIDMILIGSYPALFTGIAFLFILSNKPVSGQKTYGTTV
jgi:hypothetical protein